MSVGEQASGERGDRAGDTGDAVSRADNLRARLAWIAPALFLALLALHHAQRELGVVRARVPLALIAVAFLAGIALKLEALIYGRHRLAGLALFVAGALPVAILVLGQGTPQRATSLIPMLLGWALFCALPLRPGAAGRGRELSAATIRWLAPVVVLVGALATLAYMAFNTAGGVAVVDETLYLLQATAMATPDFSRQFDPALRDFFSVQQAVVTPAGRLYTQFPPGWPAMLALFDAVGLRWWAGVVAGTLAVLFTFLLGRELHGRFVGVVAAALLATQAYFLAMAGSYMAHAPAAACAAAAAWLLVRGERSTGRGRAGCWLVAGLLLGLAVAIRPLTGGALALSLGAWMLLRRRLTVREVGVLVALLSLGSAPAFAALLHYNRATTGHPFRFGYNVVHGPLHDMGFGTRGMVLVNETGASQAAARAFTPRVAVLQMAARLDNLGSQLLPAFLLFPILLAGAIYRYRFRWLTVAAFALLPLLYFFYWFSDWRFYVELFPFVFVGVAAILFHVWRRDRALGGALLICALAGGALTSAAYLYRRASRAAPLHAYFDAARAAQRTHGKVLLFVRSPLTESLPFTWLYALNAGPFPGDLILARDLGAENARLIARFPHHVPLRARDYSATAALFVPLGDSASAAAREHDGR